MFWTEQDDKIPRCGGRLGPVRDDEHVARLLHSNIHEPRKKALTKDELFAPAEGKQVSNECGESTGPSVDRCDQLSRAEIQRRSTEQAEKRPGRTSKGAMVASVGSLRSIRSPEREGQVLFVYDDPRPDNPEHAVLRGSRDLSPGKRISLRDSVVAAFTLAVEEAGGPTNDG